MKTKKPSLAQIEASWFRPSDRLIMRIAKNDPNIPPELRNAIEDNPDDRLCVEELFKTQPEGLDDLSDRTPPEYLLELADRRHSAQQRLKNSTLKPGSIVAIERLIGPGGELPIDFPRTAAVLLDSSEYIAGIWHGWMVSPETGYATDWDYVLQEEDGPFDPSLAGMVQLWNPVGVYAKSIARIIGEVNPGRLQAVRALAAEFLTRPEHCEHFTGPGPLGPRQTLHGFNIVTGKPIRGESDPRWRYQEIYLRVKNAVREPARAALAERPWWETVWEAVQDSLTSREPALALAMGQAPQEKSREGILADRFRVRMDSQNDKVVRLHFTRIGNDRSTIELLRNGRVTQKLDADDREKVFLLDNTGQSSLEILDVEGKLVAGMDLTETDEDWR